MRVGAVSVCLIVRPIALVHVSIRVIQLALPIGFAVRPLAVVAAAVEPLLPALAVTDAIQPLAFIHSSAVEVCRWAQFTHIVVSHISGHMRIKLAVTKVVMTFDGRQLACHVDTFYTVRCSVTIFALFLIAPESFLHGGRVDFTHVFFTCAS